MKRFAILLWLVAAPLGAQVIETPAAFDAAGRVRTITPAVAARLQLAPPDWPVTGTFAESRIYVSSAGGAVIVVERGGGILERFAITYAQLTALRARIDAAIATGGQVAADDRPQTSQRNSFVARQMVLAAGVYGPLMAAMTDDAKTGTAAYLIAVGATYFALNNIPRTTIITRAQNHLAFDGALRGAGAGAGLLRTFGDDNPGRKAVSAAMLSGAVVGAFGGYYRGVGLTDAEAHSASSFSNFAAGAALGVLGTMRESFSGPDDERLVAGTLVGAGLAGWALGPAYPRSVKYVATVGDVRVLTIGAVLGGLAGVTPFVEAENSKLAFAGATAGGLAGIALLERTWARKFDHSSADAAQVYLGTVAGALLGTAGIVLTEPEATGALLLVTGGGVLGALAGHNFANPPRAQSTGASLRPTQERLGSASRVSFDPSAIAFAAGRVPGQHALLSIRF